MPRSAREPSADILNAGRALAAGEALQALGYVGRAEDGLGLTLRGIAYAQLGDLELATKSLSRALAVTKDARTKARARAALVEIDLAKGDPGEAARRASASASELARLGDARNATMMRLIVARAAVLLGRLDEARETLSSVLKAKLDPDLRALACLAQAEVHIRAVATTHARQALIVARHVLEDAPNRLLATALVALERELSSPVARVLERGVLREADLFVVEAFSKGDVLLIDDCRRLAIAGRATVPLARRPVLFALLLELGRAWPESVHRDELAARAFDTRRVNDSHRSRLRVEVGRLRKLLDGLGASPTAMGDGYVLTSERKVAMLLPPSDDEAARLSLLLGDGAAWSANALAEHAGVSKRTAQRALAGLVESGKAIKTGSGKLVRYVRPGSPIASRMLLLGLVPKT